MTTVRQERVDDTSPAEVYDNALRWTIPSDSNPHETYLVELHSPPGYSICSCMHFECRIRPILARGMSAEQAVQQGLIKLGQNQRIENALKCKHVLAAEVQLAQSTIKAFEHARQTNTRPAPQRAQGEKVPLAPPPRLRPTQA